MKQSDWNATIAAHGNWAWFVYCYFVYCCFVYFRFVYSCFGYYNINICILRLQIFTIHCIKYGKQFPLVYFLLPSKSRETYNTAFRGEILVAFWPKHGLRSDLRVPNFSWGSMPPDTPSLFTQAHAMARAYQSKIAGWCMYSTVGKNPSCQDDVGPEIAQEAFPSY